MVEAHPSAGSDIFRVRHQEPIYDDRSPFALNQVRTQDNTPWNLVANPKVSHKDKNGLQQANHFV